MSAEKRAVLLLCAVLLTVLMAVPAAADVAYSPLDEVPDFALPALIVSLVLAALAVLIVVIVRKRRK